MLVPMDTVRSQAPPVSAWGPVFRNAARPPPPAFEIYGPDSAGPSTTLELMDISPETIEIGIQTEPTSQQEAVSQLVKDDEFLVWCASKYPHLISKLLLKH